MQDYKVCSILNNTKRMITSGKSPVDYIDGVLDTIQDGQPAVETVAPQKKPLLAADYRSGSKALF